MSNSLGPWQPVKVIRLQHEIEARDPKLARQLRQYLANHGGGSMGEQYSAHMRSAGASLATFFTIVAIGVGLVGGLLAILLIVAYGSSAPTTQPKRTYYARPTPSEQIEVRRAEPVDKVLVERAQPTWKPRAQLTEPLQASLTP